MIEFRRLVVQNFMPFGEKQVVPLAGQGIVRIEGRNLDEPGASSNMAGKSSIMEALLWCLFGKTLRGLKHEAVVNRFAKKNCSVGVSFTANEVGYVCKRFRKHSEYQNQLQLWRGDKLLSFRHEVDTQAKLEEVIGCDFQAFINSAVFGGFDGTRRQFALLTDSEQKRILDSFLHFEKFEEALQRTKDFLTEAKEKLQETRVRIERVRGEASAIREKLDALQRSEKIFSEKESEERSEVEARLRRLRSKSGPSKKDLSDATELVDRFVTKLAKASAARQQIRKRLKSVAVAIRNKEKLIGKPCPTCGQKISVLTIEGFLEHIAADRHAAKKELKAASVRVAKLERRNLYARKVLNRVQKRSQKFSYLINERKELESKLSKMTSNRPSTPFAEEINSLSVEYSRHISRLLVYEYEAKALEIRILDLQFWEQGFGNRGVKALVVREALPTLNTKLNEYAQEVFQGGVELQFRPSRLTKKGEARELFHLHYRHRFGSATYLGESSGGRRRVDICVLLVFSWLSRTCNLLLVDELLDSLDDAGREAILHILSRQRGTIFVVSHEQGLKSRFERVWTVTKKNGLSKLEIQ